MINFITIVLAIIAIIITLYASEDIRLKAYKSEGSPLKYLFDWLDSILFNNSVKADKKARAEYTNIEFIKGEPFSIDNPLYKFLELNSPLWIEDAKVFWLDLTSVNNVSYGNNLRKELVMVSLFLVLVASFLVGMQLILLAEGNYFTFLFTFPFSVFFIYLIFKGINKISIYDNKVKQAIYTSSIAFLFTKKHIYDIREKIFYSINEIEEFIFEPTDSGEKIFLVTKKRKIILLDYPTNYKDNLVSSVDYSTVVLQLNKYLLDYKELK